MPLKDFCKVLGSRPNLPLGADSIEAQVPRAAGGFGPQECCREEATARKNSRDPRKVGGKGGKTILGTSWQSPRVWNRILRSESSRQGHKK